MKKKDKILNIYESFFLVIKTSGIDFLDLDKNIVQQILKVSEQIKIIFGEIRNRENNILKLFKEKFEDIDSENFVGNENIDILLKKTVNSVNLLLNDNILKWKLELEGHENELKESGIIKTKDNKWYLKNAKSIRRGPKIGGKNLMCYPNLAFNKFNGIGNTEGIIISKEDLKKLFRLLGMEIVDSMEEKEIITNQIKKYKEIIESEKEKFIDIGVIIDDEGIWYLSEVKSVKIWPKIGGKYLPVFPSSTFNKFNKIGNKQGLIRNSKDLGKLLKFLGIKIATLKQEKIRWKKQIESYEKELAKIGIIRGKGNNWSFEKIKPANNWPKIGKNNLRTFPSIKVNKINKLGTNDGVIQSRLDLIYLFNFLGMNLIKIKKNT